MRDLCGEEGEPTDIEVIPENEQKYTSFSTKRYVEVDKGNGETFTRTIFLNFIDSCKHLQASLHILVKSLPEEQHYQMKRNFDATTVTLLNRKGVYPYEHLDRFGEDQLPPIGKFNSYLGCGGVYEEGENGETKPDEVSLEEYKYAQRVFREKKCQNFGDYTYCFMDTLHLADVFESYRKKTMETFGLDPAHYLTLPSVSNDAMLNVTKAQVELLSDQQMYLFFEEGIKGGVSVAVKRYSKVNNVYMGSKYDSGKEIIYILHLDKNALYVGCMTKPLPYHNFRWISKERLAHMEIDHSLIRGCTLEVDLDVPRDQAFHDYTNCYPLAPEHKVVGGSTKLVPNLLDRRHYIVHYSALQEYLKHGLILKKIHRGVSYEDKDYIRPYIELCTEMRKKAKREVCSKFMEKISQLCVQQTNGKCESAFWGCCCKW